MPKIIVNGKVYNTVYIAATAAPKANGTAAVGISTKYAREDHVHPLQTTISGNAGTATKLANVRTIQTNLGKTDAVNFDGSSNVTPGVTGTLPIGNGGTGQTTAENAANTLLNGLSTGDSDITNDETIIITQNIDPTKNTYHRRPVKFLWNYIKAKADQIYLGKSANAASATKLATTRTIRTKLDSTSTANFDGSSNVTPGVTGTLPIGNGGTGGTTAAAALDNLLTGTASKNFKISKTTSTYLAGNKGEAIINSTAEAGSYTMLAKMNSTNGYFTTGTYQDKYLLQYTVKTTVDAETNSVTKSVNLLDESGNTSFPGTVAASGFTGNASSATKLKTARKIDGVSFNGSADIIHYGTCDTAAATAAKVVACTSFALVTGSTIKVKFTVTNTAANPTLNVNSTGAKAIFYRGAAISAGYLAAKRVYEFIYDGTNYELVGDINTNTTYSNMTAATASAAGKAGLAPAPPAGAQTKFLRGDGTWQTPPDTNTTYTAASAAPKANGTAAVGSSAKYAREDHVHPTSKAFSAGNTAPADTNLLWIDTGNGGILKYHNGTAWVTVQAVWG